MRLKVFVSQPMSGRTAKEIEAERKELLHCIEKITHQKVRDIFPYREYRKNLPAASVFAKGVAQLAKADVAVFGTGWELARGCVLEAEICDAYGIISYRRDSTRAFYFHA